MSAQPSMPGSGIPPAQPAAGKRWVWIAVVIVAVLAIVLTGVYMVSRSLGRAAQGGIADLAGLANVAGGAGSVAQQMADFTLPAGFVPGAGLTLGEMRVATFEHADGQSNITFFQSPSWLEETEQQVLDSMQSSASTFWPALATSQAVQVEINGQPQTVYVGDGVSSDGTAFRAAALFLTLRGVRTLVSYERPVASWSDADMEAFFASIR